MKKQTMTTFKPSLWQWVKGRQEQTEYYKFTLWFFKIWKFGFDAYLLKYKAFTNLPIHTDPVKNGKHWRLNINLKGNSLFYIESKTACYFKKEGTYYKILDQKINLFRADLKKHYLKVFSNTTKLSLGFVKFNT